MNDNQIIVYASKEFGQIRTVEMEGEPWFVGKDIAEALGYENPQKAIRVHVDEEDKKMGEQNGTPYILDSLGRKQYPTFINESGLYSLIMSSKLPNAKQFKRWVTSDVLPTIHKHGFYGTDSFLDTAIADPDLAIGLIENLKKAREERKIAQENEKRAKEKMLEAQYGQKIAQKKTDIISSELQTVSGDIKYARALNSKHENNITWTEMVALINKNRNKKVGKNKFLKELREKGVLQKQKKSWNLPKGEYSNKEYFIVNRELVYRNGQPMINQYSGEQIVNTVVLVTPKGQKFLLKKFCDIKESEIIWLNEDEIEKVRLEEMKYDPERVI